MDANLIAEKSLIAVLNDVMFTVKIQQAAKQTGMAVHFVKSRTELLQQVNKGPTLVIIDLNYDAVRPLELIRELKGDERTEAIRVVGYVSHVQTDLRQAAQQAGCDVVVARSAFVQNLPALLTT